VQGVTKINGMAEHWYKDFDGALRLEAGDVVLRVKKIKQDYEGILQGYEWGVYQNGKRKWSGWHDSKDALVQAKLSAKRCALKTILAQVSAPESAVTDILEIAGLSEENENGG